MKRRLLKEEQAPEISPEKSLDAQVLAFFTKAERLSIGTQQARNPLEVSGVAESVSRKKMTQFLFEGDDEDSPKIDIDSFASEVARLIKNAEYLLDIKGTILQMAENYVKNSHSSDDASSLIEVLERDYDLSKEGKKKEEPNTNFAAGARTAPS